MRNKVAKEIRKHVRIQFPHLETPENKDKKRQLIKKMKRAYKMTPWNKRNKVIVH